MVKRFLNTASIGGLFLLLGACNVGSDQQPTGSISTMPAQTSSVQAQAVKPAVTATTTATTPVTAETHTEIYYLVLHGLNAAGAGIGNSIEFQKSVQTDKNPGVQLIWFEPNRKADGSCLQDLSAYRLEYGMQPNNYNTTLKFDLASRDMSCSTVGTTECGDVRECRYNLTL